jgi:biotin carboxyl carrier protein
VVADTPGTVKEVKCNKGDAVEAEAVLIVLE